MNGNKMNWINNGNTSNKKLLLINYNIIMLVDYSDSEE